MKSFGESSRLLTFVKFVASFGCRVFLFAVKVQNSTWVSNVFCAFLL